MSSFSLYRVAALLSLFGLSTTVGTIFVSGEYMCGSAQSCIAAVALPGIEFASPKNADMAQTTPALAAPADVMFFPTGLQLIAFYALILAFTVFFFMEIRKPHYSRKFRRSLGTAH